MRKIVSTAALTLQLTWKAVLALFAAVGLIQWFWGFRITASQGDSFENGIAGPVTMVGALGMLALLAVLILCGTQIRGSRFPYTLCRLGVRPRTVGFLFSAVFAGYFFLYWIFQLVMVLVFYGRYIEGAMPNANHLLVAAYRSGYFHLLLPLRDGLGYWRNAVICLNFAVLATVSQRCKLGYVLMICSLFMLLFLPSRMGTLGTDILQLVILGGLTMVGCGVIWGEVGWRED